MKKETFQKWFENNYHKGTYVVIEKMTITGDFAKLTRMVGRFVDYYNIASVIAKGKKDTGKKRDYEIQIIPHVLKTNTNTGNDLLMVYKTNHHKAHSKYFYLGTEISKDDYYSMSGEKQKEYGDTPLFMFKMQEVVSVGGIK